MHTIEQEIRVENNKLVFSVPRWGPTFKISFEVNILSFSNCNPDKMANLLTFTATDNDCCEIGDRVPALFINSQGFLQVANHIDEDGNWIDRSPHLNQNQWYMIEVEQYIEHNEVIYD